MYKPTCVCELVYSRIFVCSYMRKHNEYVRTCAGNTCLNESVRTWAIEHV